MNKQEKREFIDSILDMTRGWMIARLDVYPENWDGLELRQLIADFAQEQIAYVKMDRKRKKEYENTRIVNNI